jgi:hypothetical protein
MKKLLAMILCVLLLMPTTFAFADGTMKDGIYAASANGMDGLVQIEVTIKDDKITDIVNTVFLPSLGELVRMRGIVLPLLDHRSPVSLFLCHRRFFRLRYLLLFIPGFAALALFLAVFSGIVAFNHDARDTPMLINDFSASDKILPVELPPNSDQTIADRSRKICVEITAFEIAPADDFPCYDFTFLDEIFPSVALHQTNVLCCLVKNDRA